MRFVSGGCKWANSIRNTSQKYTFSIIGTFSKAFFCFLGIRHKEQVARKERLDFMSLSYTKGTWIIIFGALCVFLNLLILFKMIM